MEMIKAMLQRLPKRNAENKEKQNSVKIPDPQVENRARDLPNTSRNVSPELRNGLSIDYKIVKIYLI
jgi:hypothetical protein